MCPLRLILLFLSATLAGFFVLKNLTSKPDDLNTTEELVQPLDQSEFSASLSTKVKSAIGYGFWVFVDMASGKYLWRNLSSSSSKVNQL